jgi:hypothetical protein
MTYQTLKYLIKRAFQRKSKRAICWRHIWKRYFLKGRIQLAKDQDKLQGLLDKDRLQFTRTRH